MTHSHPDAPTATCPDRERLLDIAFGRLPQHVITAVHHHIAHCGNCEKFLAELDPASDEFCILVRDSARDLLRGYESESAETLQNLSSDLRTLAGISDRMAREAAGPAAWPTSPSLAEAVQIIAVAEDVSPAASFYDASMSETALSAATESHWELGGFELCSVLGIGGMSIVFEAIEHPIERRVALKVVQPHVALRPGFSDRFLREARSLAAIESDHVVTIFRFGQFQTLNYLTMPVLPGRSLAAWLEQCSRLDPGEVIRLGLDLATGLSAIHEAGLIHRDLSPANVWLRSNSAEADAAPTGKSPACESATALSNRTSRMKSVPVRPSERSDRERAEAIQMENRPSEFLWQRAELIDFGLARQIDEDSLTGSRIIVGTPGYIAPEVTQGHPATVQSDLYALGSILHRALTGTVPSRKRPLLEALTESSGERHDIQHAFTTATPSPLETLILDLLQPLPENRPASAAEVAQRLSALQQPDASGSEVRSIAPGHVKAVRSSSSSNGAGQPVPATPAIATRSGYRSAPCRGRLPLFTLRLLAAGGTLVAFALALTAWRSRDWSGFIGSRGSIVTGIRDENSNTVRKRPFPDSATDADTFEENTVSRRPDRSDDFAQSHQVPQPAGRLAFEEMFDRPDQVLNRKDQQHTWGIAHGVYYDEVHANQAGLGYFAFVGPDLINFRYECLCRVHDGGLKASFRVLGDDLRQSHLECALRPDGHWSIRRLDRRRPNRQDRWSESIETEVSSGEFPAEWFPAASRWAVFSIVACEADLEIRLDQRTVTRATDVRFLSTPTPDPVAGLPDTDLPGATDNEAQRSATPPGDSADEDGDLSTLLLKKINWRQLGNSTSHCVRMGYWALSSNPARFEMDWQRLWQLELPATRGRQM